ncbi:MAG: hypothetical protein IT164_09445 [Bryobacterales bacterium]|nr:hypothetical protein [Bryobacterales bacterium]
MTRNRLTVALACYATLALAAAFLLRNEARLVVWVFLAGLAVKSWVAYKKETLD